MDSTSRLIVASFVFAITPSSVEEYPREAIFTTSFHAVLRPASNPSRNVFFRSLAIRGIRSEIPARGVKAFQLSSSVNRCIRGLPSTAPRAAPPTPGAST